MITLVKLRSRSAERFTRRLPGKELARVERTRGTTQWEWRLQVDKGAGFIWRRQVASCATDATWRSLPYHWLLLAEGDPPATRAAAERQLADLVQERGGV